MHYFIKAFNGKLNLIPHLIITDCVGSCSVSLVRALKLCEDEWPRAARRPPAAEQHSLAFPRGTGFLGHVYSVCLLGTVTQKLEFLCHSSIQELGKCLSELIFPCNRASFTQIIWKEVFVADTSPARTPQTLPGCEGFLRLWEKYTAEMPLPHHQK